MTKKIVAIGLRTDQKRNIFSGQAMMFDALVDFLESNGYNVGIVNLSSKYTNIKVGKFSFKRTWEYFSIIMNSLPILFKHRGGLLYITTAQTKSGFLRDLVFIQIASFFKYKILLQQFGSNFESFYFSLSPSLQKLVKRTFEKGDKIIVEGEFTKEQFSMITNYKVKVVPVTNGLPEKKLKSSNKGKTIKQGELFRMIYLSYMIESKGYWDVIEAVDILVNQMNRNIHCVFAGAFKDSIDDTIYSSAGEASIAFQEFIKEKKLNSNVKYLEGLMGEQKANAFNDANVFLLPSYFKFEGQPVSVLEAMAYGAVPIVTKYRMIPNMVTSETGIFVDAKSPLQIAENISFLIDHPELYQQLSQENVNRYLSNFTLEKYCNNIEQVIFTII